MSGSKMFENFLFNYNMTFIKFTKSLIVRDKVREYLEKNPAYRSDDDIEVLLDFMQHMPAFSNMTLSTRRELCAVMVFAVVEKADTVVLKDGEQLDTWSVILNGHVEISKPDGTIEHLHMGDSFGVSPTLDPQFHCGTMRTKVDDCQFVCIAQRAYHQIFHKGEESMVRLEENGEVVTVLEKKKMENGRMGQVVLRATPEKLFIHLIEDNEADRTYVEDFLLTYRTFLRSPTELTNRLVTWFCDPTLRDKVVNIVLLWTSNHFLDFDTDSVMWEFLEKFEVLLEAQKLSSQLQALHSIYTSKSRPRSIVLLRVNRDDPLCFSIVGGTERNVGIFISKVEKGSRGSEAGLKRGDQIIEVNNCNFEHVSYERALEILRSTTHLAITVKSNLHFCRQLLQSPENSPRHMRSIQSSAEQKAKSLVSDGDSHSASSVGVGSPSKILHNKLREKVSSPAQGSKIRKAFLRFNLLQRADSSDLQLNHEFSSSHPCSRKSSSLSDNSGLGHPLSTSDPDLVSTIRGLDKHTDIPESVIRVYRADQSFRYLPIHKETTAREVVLLALTEFGVADPSCNYSLYEVTFDKCGIRTKHLPDQLSDLADRCRLNSRYYLKNNKSMESLFPDELSVGILHECQVSLLHLLPAEVAIQLTLRDFRLFQNIPSTEYVNDLFELESRTGFPNLSQFSELVNQEMFWVVSEVCSEQNLLKRMKIIKHFIKIAKHCRVARNFNSFFAILSGLGHGSVSRLRLTWEKLSTKYMKLFEEMQDAMDPSRNMSKYRNMLNAHLAHPPVIPFFPLVKKDLTFIHFGNDSRVDGLVNFDKLRMIAKEIRQVNRLASNANYGKSSWPYENILPNFSCLATSMHGTIRHRKTTAASILNPRKMYDEALMARRVRTYLANLKIVDDELKLAHMSSLCEPPGPTTNQKKTDPPNSPSPSDVNHSTAVVIPAFGSTSPTSVRKLLSLSNRSRPVDQKKRPLSLVPSVLPVRESLSASSSSSTSSANHRGVAFRRQKKLLPLLSVISLPEESSSVTGVGRPGSASSVSRKSEGAFEKLVLNCPADVGRNQVDSDSGYSSITSSVLDGHSPLSSDLENGLGVLTELERSAEEVLAYLPMPILTASLPAETLSPMASGFDRYVFQPPTPPNQRAFLQPSGRRSSRTDLCPLSRNFGCAIRNVKGQRKHHHHHHQQQQQKQQQCAYLHQRSSSYDGVENYSSLPSSNVWDDIEFDDDADELVSVV